MCMSILEIILNKYTNKNTPKYIIKGKYLCKVVDVYDGDTIKVVFLYNFKFQCFSLRIKNIDAPEIKTVDKKEKEAAIDVREYVKKLILNQVVNVHIDGFDKYGRLLGDVYCKIEGKDNISLSEHLLDNKMVVYYDGKHKKMWKDWERPPRIITQELK